MKRIQYIFISLLFIVSSLPLSYGQSLTVDLINHTYDGTHHDLKIAFDVQGNFYEVQGDISLDLTNSLYSNWSTLRLKYDLDFKASNGKTYKVTVDEENIGSTLRFTLRETNGTDGGLVTLIPTGGMLLSPPAFIKQGNCAVLAKTTISNCSGQVGSKSRPFNIAGNSDQLPYYGNCGNQGNH